MAADTDRKENCWACKYFIATAPETATQGVCVRRAPTKNDQVNAGSSVYPPLGMFKSLTQSEITFCGEFDRMEGTIPPIPE